MHHWKINGNSVFFFKYTIKDGVLIADEDTRGTFLLFKLIVICRADHLSTRLGI